MAKHVYAILHRARYMGGPGVLVVMTYRGAPAVFRLRRDAEQVIRAFATNGVVRGAWIVKVPTSTQEVQP